MFKINKNHDIEIEENIEKMDLDKLRKLYLITIAKGEVTNYIELINTRNIKANYLFEQALVYGRYQILEHMLQDEKYKIYLKNDYDPFLLECCDPDVTNDVYNGSWWSNDEHERAIVNKKGIDHKKCFEMLKPFGKKLSCENFLKWLNISCNQIKYYGGCYFAKYKVMFDEIFDNNYDIKDIVLLLQELFPATFILDIVCDIFPADILIKKMVL